MHDSKATACFDTFCSWDDWSWRSRVDLRRFCAGLAAYSHMVPGRTALAYLSGLIMLIGGAGLLFDATVTWSVRAPVSLSHPVDAVEGALSRGCASDRGCVAGVWGACGVVGWRLDSVCCACEVAGEIIFGIRFGGTRRSSCADIFCGLGLSDWACTHYVCEGDRGHGAGVASFSKGLGLPDWVWADCLQSWRVVFDLSACGRCGRGGNDQPVCASGVGACRSGCAEDAVSMDSVPHLMGDCGRGVGGGPEYWDEEICYARCVTEFDTHRGGLFNRPLQSVYRICRQIEDQGALTYKLDLSFRAAIGEHYHMAPIRIPKSNMGDTIAGSLRGANGDSIGAKDLCSAVTVSSSAPSPRSVRCG